MKFYQWLMQYTTEDSALGDLARDVKADPSFPRRASSKHTIHSYLAYIHACEPCLTTFTEAWDGYKREIGVPE